MSCHAAAPGLLGVCNLTLPLLFCMRCLTSQDQNMLKRRPPEIIIRLLDISPQQHTAHDLLQRAGFAKAKEARPDSKGGQRRDDGKLQLMLQALMPQPSPKPQRSAAELEAAAKMAKEYSRLKMMEHRGWQKDLQMKMRLRDEAIQALPTLELQLAACQPDWEPFPLNRQIYYSSPPLDVHERSAEEKAQAEKAAKGARARVQFGTKQQH